MLLVFPCLVTHSHLLIDFIVFSTYTLSVTDKTAPAAMTWLESTLPESTAAYDGDAKDLAKLRDEVRILEEELKQEGERNTELQKQIVVSRKRGDEMVSLMGLLRSETEAVLER